MSHHDKNFDNESQDARRKDETKEIHPQKSHKHQNACKKTSIKPCLKGNNRK